MGLWCWALRIQGWRQEGGKVVCQVGREEQGRWAGHRQKLQTPRPWEDALLLCSGQDHSADLHLAAKCCSNQSALIPCQSLSNGGKVCRSPAHPDGGASLELAGDGPEGKGWAWLFGPRKAKDAEHEHRRLMCSSVCVQTLYGG